MTNYTIKSGTVKKGTKQNYLSMLEYFLNKIDKVDKQTPWQEIEPEWWIDMIEIREFILNKKEKIS